ncbi:MAG: ribosomal protein S18-alanine N-acetyltransferase [Pseudomonadota bacterium]
MTDFRILGAEDAAELAELHGQGFDSPWTPDSFTALLSRPASFGLGVIDGSPPQLAGFGLFQRVGDEAEILTLVVADKFRRKGLARALLWNTEKHLSARGCTRLFLEVAEDNLAALSLYDSLDFRLEGRRSRYYSRGQDEAADAFVMSRMITGLPG